MLDVTKETGQEGRHNVEVAKDIHHVALLDEVVVVVSQFHDFSQVMVRVLLIGVVLNAVDERDKVFVSYRKLFQEAVLLEQSETKVNQEVVPH